MNSSLKYDYCVKCRQWRRMIPIRQGYCQKCFLGYDISKTVKERLDGLELCPGCTKKLNDIYNDHVQAGKLTRLGINPSIITRECPICRIFYYSDNIRYYGTFEQKIYLNELVEKKYQQQAQEEILSKGYLSTSNATRYVRIYGLLQDPMKRNIRKRVRKKLVNLNNLCSVCHIELNEDVSWARWKGYDYYIATIDHIIPFSKGGLSIDGNLEVMCQSCNSSKRDHDIVVNSRIVQNSKSFINMLIFTIVWNHLYRAHF